MEMKPAEFILERQLAWMLVAFLLGACVTAQTLQALAPRAGESKSPTPNQQTQANQHQAEDVRGTQESPAVVRMLPIPRNPEEAEQEQADRERQTATNRWLIGLTGAVALFTLGLIVVGVLQWLTYNATLATTRTLERARFAIEKRKIEGLVGGRVRIEFEAANRGRSVAAVTRTAETVYFLPSLPQPPIGPPWKESPEVVQVGEPVVVELVVESVNPDQAKGIKDGTHLLHVVGRIEYSDVFKETHVRGYAFTYDEKGQTFHPPKNAPGYNFET